jgi:flagellar biosynthesis/type III secretory pathway chaperone
MVRVSQNHIGAEKLAEQLIETLRQQLSIYSHLYDLVAKEKEILVSAQIDQLNENNESKEKMLERLNELEGERRNQVRDMAVQLDLANEPKLTECLLRLPSPLRIELSKLRDGLVLAIERVAELNRSNEMLIESSLQNIGSAIYNLRGVAQGGVTYQKYGQMNQQNAAGRLVRREV